MANTFTLKSHTYDGRYLELTCSQSSTDIATNTSTISWTLTVAGGNSSFYSTGPTKVIINGTEVCNLARASYTTKAFPAARGSTSGTLKVKHTDNGSKTIAVSLTTAIYDVNAITKSGNWTLDTIPRAAQISSVSTFTDKTNPVITYSNPLGSAATLEAYIYDEGDKVQLAGPFALSNTGTSATLTLSNAQKTTLYKQVPAGKDNVKVLFWIKTKIGSSSYWSNSVKQTFTIVDGEPVLQNITWMDANETTSFLTHGSAIVKGQSDIQFRFEAVPQKEATIVSYSLTNGEQTISSNTGTFQRVENGVITYSATDSHGFTAEDTHTIPVIDYVNLTCHQEAEIELVGETGAQITLTISGNYSNIDFGEENNFLDLFYRITDDSGEWLEWTYIGDIQPTLDEDNNTYRLTLTIEGLSYDKSYRVQSKATDWISTNIETPELTLTLIPIFDWSDKDFNFNVPITVQGKSLDFVAEAGTKDGWTYRKWDSGLAECWKILSHTTTLNTAWGALYCGNTLMSRQNYPFVFAEKPVEMVNLLATGNAGWITPESGGQGMNGQYATAIYNVVRPNAVSTSQTFNFAFYIRGKWK